MTPTEALALVPKLRSQIGDDVREIYSTEVLFKAAANAIESLARALAEGPKVRALTWECTDWSAGDGIEGENDCVWEPDNSGPFFYMIEWMGAGEFRVTLHDYAITITEGGLSAAIAAKLTEAQKRVLKSQSNQPFPHVRGMPGVTIRKLIEKGLLEIRDTNSTARPLTPLGRAVLAALEARHAD